MIDEKVLLSYIQQNRRTKIMSWDSRSGGYNSAMDAVEEFINKMPKTDPIILKPNDEETRNKLRDTEFERDFYKMHFEDLYRRKVEG